jgi:hypothetical protein
MDLIAVVDSVRVSVEGLAEVAMVVELVVASPAFHPRQEMYYRINGTLFRPNRAQCRLCNVLCASIDILPITYMAIVMLHLEYFL